MKIFFLRIFLLLLLVFLQFSFFNILFPWFRAPLFLLGVVVIFSLVRGFPSTLFMTVPLTLLFDALTVGEISWLTPYAVFFAYVTSFLLRRLLLEHRGVGLVLYALLAYGAALLYQALFPFVVSWKMVSVSTLLTLPSTDSLLFALVLFVPLFVVTYFCIGRFESYLELLNQKQFRNVR